MKTTVWLLGLCLALPLAAQAAGELPAAASAPAAAPAAAAAATAAVAPASGTAPAAGALLAAPPAPEAVAEAPRTPARLRDDLRHWFSGSDTQQEPFRLTTEERRRLREQLRTPPGQPAPAR